MYSIPPGVESCAPPRSLRCSTTHVLERFWKDADELGYHGVWNYDHFYGLYLAGQPLELPTLEGWTTLAAMGKVTQRARIGCMVTGVTYRHPALLANMAVSVDHISGGRLEFGLGAAWHEPEHLTYGIDFPSAGHAHRDARRGVRDHPPAVDGGQGRPRRTLLDAEGRVSARRSPSKTRIPIVIGGSGPKKTLRVVAKHADEWNAPAATPEEYTRLADILDRALRRRRTRPGGDQAVRADVPVLERRRYDRGACPPQIDELEEVGVQHVVLSFYTPPTRDQLKALAPQLTSGGRSSRWSSHARPSVAVAR